MGRSADPFLDIDWADVELASSEAGLGLAAGDPLAATEWYRSLPDSERAVVGLARITTSLTTAAQFENILQRGLLHRALYMSLNEPEHRYIHHEVIEESQHTLMFAELVRRAGADPRGMPRSLRRLAEWLIPVLARLSPVVFFSMVLAGEEPLDMIQRRALRDEDLHPLVAEVMRIHVSEEARHISYARAAIRDEAPSLNRLRRHTVALGTPIALAIMARLMLRPHHDLANAGVPREVLRESARSRAGRDELAAGVARTRSLLADQGLLTRPARWLWRTLGIA